MPTDTALRAMPSVVLNKSSSLMSPPAEVFYPHRAVAAEFIGTCIFVMTSVLAVSSAVVGNADADSKVLLIATAFGVSLIVVIYSCAGVSGGHINPAVTLALALAGHIDPIMAVAYGVAQCLGAILGAALADGIVPTVAGALSLGPNVTLGAGFLAEVVGTAFLVMTVFSTAVQTSRGRSTPDKDSLRAQAPLVIGMSVWATHLALIGVTGCGINPARWLGTFVVLKFWEQAAWTQAWIYIVGPIIGACLALVGQVVLYGDVRPNDGAVVVVATPTAATKTAKSP